MGTEQRTKLRSLFHSMKVRMKNHEFVMAQLPSALATNRFLPQFLIRTKSKWMSIARRMRFYFSHCHFAYHTDCFALRQMWNVRLFSQEPFLAYFCSIGDKNRTPKYFTKHIAESRFSIFVLNFNYLLWLNSGKIDECATATIATAKKTHFDNQEESTYEIDSRNKSRCSQANMMNGIVWVKTNKASRSTHEEHKRRKVEAKTNGKWGKKTNGINHAAFRSFRLNNRIVLFSNIWRLYVGNGTTRRCHKWRRSYHHHHHHLENVQSSWFFSLGWIMSELFLAKQY